MAQVILFPSQNISSDTIPDPLETILIDKIEVSDIDLNVSLGFGSSNLVINLIDVDTSNLDLEYSIDNQNWFNSNVFEIQQSGTYTAFIKDQFGCSIQKQFTVDEIKTREDYISIPSANCFSFVKIEQTNEIDLFDNDENLFECDQLVKIGYSNSYLFSKKDKPALQIKTNLSLLEVYLRKENGTEQQILMSKKSNNLDRFKKLDCVAYSHSSERLAVYFESGNEYNENGDIIAQHDLQGDLPDFAQIGNYVEITGLGVFEISSILLDYDLNKRIIIFEEEYLEEELQTSALCIYDLLDFEVYETYFNFTQLEDGYYDIYIKATSSLGQVYEYLSENIFIQDNHERTFAIHYYNEDNKDLFYKYGLINQLRVEYSDLERYNKDESEINVNDNTSNLIKSFLNFGYNFVFEDLTTNQLDILSTALSCENVFINGIAYIKDGSFSIEKSENTNIYKLEARMLKTNVKLVLGNPRFSVIDFLIPNTIPSI